jgi:hypothetical protein
MAFSLQGFGAGFASKMSQRLDEDRIRQEKLQDEARREATRVRLAKQAEREREKKEIEEKTGLMKALGFSDTSIEKALGQGMGAVGLYVEAAKANYGREDFFDPNVMFSVADAGETPSSIAEDIRSTSKNIDIADAPSITETSLSGITPERNRRAEYLKAAFGKPPKEYGSLDAYHASIVQQIMRTSDPAKITALEAKEKRILAKIKEKQEENEEDGKIDDNWMSAENVLTNFGKAFRNNLQTFQVKYDSLNDEILGATDGKSGQIEIARLRAANDLAVLNNSVAIPDVKLTATINNEISKAKISLSTYANRVASGYRQVANKEVDENSLTTNTRFDIRRFKGVVNSNEELNALTFGFSDVVQLNDGLYIYVGSNVPLPGVTEQFPFYKVGS